jgi:hypothetical protein
MTYGVGKDFQGFSSGSPLPPTAPMRHLTGGTCASFQVGQASCKTNVHYFIHNGANAYSRAQCRYEVARTIGIVVYPEVFPAARLTVASTLHRVVSGVFLLLPWLCMVACAKNEGVVKIE